MSAGRRLGCGAPFEKLEGYKANRGWTFPWYSSFGSDFNYDFHVSIDASAAPVQFNFRDADALVAHDLGRLLDGPIEQPGHRAFLMVDGEIFHHVFDVRPRQRVARGLLRIPGHHRSGSTGGLGGAEGTGGIGAGSAARLRRMTYRLTRPD